ncbi:unnamed protein product [Aureobasidium vineae]|uniref:Mediator of RNA polymerase II transcription subunit 1 n=1 Tax=Aureobasidium vineae TaxID=2773715 RepID=A0A9N8PFT9_9PEZI|nr:unnamed protein product [Aureobasidium vineae]
MTTPNASSASLLSKHSQPQLTNSNPAHANTITPRSVPSTANKAALVTTAQPQHAATSKPATGGIAMTSSLSQTSNSSIHALSAMSNNLLAASPNNNLLAFASPAALAGLDMSTPSALLDAAATSQPMNLSLSDLGISSHKPNQDEERRLKLDTLLTKLLGPQHHRRFGRVSEEGVRRVGRWAGLDVEVEAKREARKFEGNRPVAVAGKNNVLIDFQFKDNLPTHIDLSFSSQDQAVTAHQPAAASVLIKDLTPPPGVSAINTKLDRFAANLETLARLDKLSVYDQLNCFEAITGVYESLRKLYEHEKQAARTIVQAKRGDSELRAERHVLCKRSGRPQMHARRKIGLSLDYWMEKSNVYPSYSPETAKDASAMDLDPKPSETPRKENEDTIFALDITAEAGTPDPYSSIRVSSSWIADRILKSAEETTDPTDLLSGTQSIDWQDPAPTYLSDSNQNNTDAMAIDNNPNTGAQKLPAVRFVARLNPPLAMPWTAAAAILQSVGAASVVSDIPDMQRTYEGSLLQKPSDVPLLNKPLQSSGSAASTTTNVLTPDGTSVQHKNALYVPKQDFGYVLTSIPFAHPRQVVALLPVLRQWAYLGSLLKGTFLEGSSPAPSQDEPSFSLADLLSGTNINTGNAVAVDISLSTQPSPTLEFVFPVSGVEGGLASLGASVSADGHVVVLSQNVVKGSQEEQDKAAQKMAKALELVGDIGVWVEWIRNVYGGAA